MTAVQTRDSLKVSNLPGLPLFNDARVLNTAMTRAQSQVVVVGDAASLCCFGKCSKIWKSFIDHCISNNNVAAQHYTKDFFEKDVMETARFQRVTDEDESNVLTDAILQELKDEYAQLKTESSSDEENLELKESDHWKSRELCKGSTNPNVLLELCEKQPVMYKRGKFVKESYQKGYVIPFQEPYRQIKIQGRSNVGKAFTGDEVVIQTAKVDQTARVIGVVKTEESARKCVCFLEEEDHNKRRQVSSSNFLRRMMRPVKKSVPRICILINKKRRNFIPIWEQIDGSWTLIEFRHLKEVRDCVFLVQVIDWKEQCFSPLGKVTAVLPNTGPSNDSLWLLKEEFDVSDTFLRTHDGLFNADEDNAQRKDELQAVTFTVDPAGAEDLDDAISIRDIGNSYELGIHISDVASFVMPHSKLDADAKEHGCTHYPKGQKPIHMFPQELSTDHFSLKQDEIRRVVSLIFEVEKETNEMIKKRFQLSRIKSSKQMTYEEAEKIITKRYKEKSKFNTVEDCVAVAYCFAKAQRKARLVDWAYYQTDKDRLPGKRKAHLMIEELSVLFNKYASETLVSSNYTMSYTPLRCQASPHPEKLEEFKEKCRELIPLSFHVRHKVDHDEQPSTFQRFRLLKEVWKDILSAARADDTDKMVDLVAADDIHPALQTVIDQFKRCCTKSYVVRSNASLEAQAGHYSLSLASYTQASSPIRRYMDLVLQRLLHSAICNESHYYTRAEITDLCRQFEETQQKSREFERNADKYFYAVSTKKQSAPKLALVVHVDQEEDCFKVSFPFNMFPLSVSIIYNELQLEDQPINNKEENIITLKWKRRIYAVDSMQIHQELNMMPDSGPCIELPFPVWNSVIEAIENGNIDHAKSLLMGVETQEIVSPQPLVPRISQTNTCISEVRDKQSEHWADILLHLHSGSTIQVQMTSELKRGFLMPVVQLVHIKPKFEICVDHVHSPIKCFCQAANEPSMVEYWDIKQYIRIWEPLCKMESAATAVDESDNIIIENLVVSFKQKQKGTLTGEFFLNQRWIKEWAIECNLTKCLLCIRKRGLKLPSDFPSEHFALVDPKVFVWVAHGVTTNVSDQEKTGKKVEFYIKHLPMETIPDCVFQKNTRFTVEIIPKGLPDM